MQIFSSDLLLLFGFSQRWLFLSIYLFLLWADPGLGFGAGFSLAASCKGYAQVRGFLL